MADVELFSIFFCEVIFDVIQQMLNDDRKNMDKKNELQ